MTNKFGAHALLFTDDWNADTARASCDSAARIGFDLFEVLLFDPWSLDVSMTKSAIRDAGLEPRLGMALGPDTDISSLDPDTHARGKKDVLRALEIANELEAPGVSGITYAAFNSYSAAHTPQQYDKVLDAFAQLDQRAGELGVKLGIEPVNRYESYMIQTLDQAVKLIKDSGVKNCFAHMDTFHMNIEEGNVPATIARNADYLGYAHVAENDRGTLGAGSFDFKAYFRALAQNDYAGDFTVESFSPAVLSDEISGAVRLWREPWQEAEKAAAIALDFMKNQWRMAQEASGQW